MSIKVQCPNPGCGKVFSVKSEYAGRKAKCPGCASSLIIPTPEPAAGGFDFGSLAPAAAAAPPPVESANPFAELEAAPPKPKTSRPPEPPRPVPPLAPVVPSVPVAEVLEESPPAPAVLPFVETEARAASAGAFADITETQTPALPTGPEPWYYGFLSGYATVLILLGGLLALLIALGGVGVAVMGIGIGGSLIYSVVIVVSSLLSAAMVFLGVLIMVAFILLSVDAARNLREIRRQLKK